MISTTANEVLPLGHFHRSPFVFGLAFLVVETYLAVVWVAPKLAVNHLEA